MPPELIPDQVLSASSMICGYFPDTWAIQWVSTDAENRLKKAAAFGISQNDLPHVTAWATGSVFKEFGWPSAFYSLEQPGKRERSSFQVSAILCISSGKQMAEGGDVAGGIPIKC